MSQTIKSMEAFMKRYLPKQHEREQAAKRKEDNCDPHEWDIMSDGTCTIHHCRKCHKIRRQLT